MSAETQLQIPSLQDTTHVIDDTFYFDLQHGILQDRSGLSFTDNSSSTADNGGAPTSPTHLFDLSTGDTDASVAPDGHNSADSGSVAADNANGVVFSDTGGFAHIENVGALNFNDISFTHLPQDLLSSSEVGDGSSANGGAGGDAANGPALQVQPFDLSSGPLDFPPGPDADPGLIADAGGNARPSGGGGGSHGGGGGGGGGHGGGSTPADYTTDSGTGVDIHVTYDSSVGSAPAEFTSVVQQVADFFASTLQDSTPITLNIDVGFGEVDGLRMGHGAIGESVTNLQDVSYSDLTSAYSTTGLSLGSSVPSGNLYVSDAQAKALDIPFASPQAVDGYVGFSSKSGIFDYNNADGVSSGQYDFFGAVAHEFSEVMGRILLVGSSINNAPAYMAYDLFHYSSPGVQDFSGNGGYFSIDQGATDLADFNNPSNGGDAGDWASSGTSHSGGSVYDAFNAFGTPGEVTPVSHTDLLALHAAGFDLVA